MADLVTHLCTALLPGAFLRDRRLGPVACGTILPDLLSRVPPLGLELLYRANILELPRELLFPWGVLHEPVALILLCTVGAMAVVERHRVEVFTGLMAGCALHLGLDVLQDHEGQGYFLLAPFSLHRYELGLIGSEATVPIALPLAALTALAWAWTSWWRSRSSPPR